MKNLAFGAVLALGGMAQAAQSGPRFEDHSEAVTGLVYSGEWEHFVGGGVAVFDCNADHLPEIFAAGGTEPAALFRNLGTFGFERAPLAEMRGVTGAYPLDIDGDGMLDLYVMRVGPDVALRGGPDCSFVDATEELGIPADDRWTTAFTAWWQDDGRPVMAVGHYVDRANPEGPFGACDGNILLWPHDNGWRAEPLEPGFCALSMLAARDARGLPGLRISNDRHYYVSGGYEQMWDIGEHRFLGEADGWKQVSLWGMGIASRDLTGDGRDEVMLTSMGDQLMQIAQADGSYAAAPYGIGTYSQRPYFGDDGRPSTGWHAQFGDIDNDGRADLFISKGNVDQMPSNAIHDPNNLLMQQADGTFTEAALDAGVATVERSRGAALADFDGDGRLDLVVVNRRAPMELYRNVSEPAGHWLGVDLRQPGGNRNAIGAVVTVTAAGRSQSQQMVVGGGHAGGQALPLHFGLGDGVEAQVEVQWPGGQVTTHSVAADEVATLTRD